LKVVQPSRALKLKVRDSLVLWGNPGEDVESSVTRSTGSAGREGDRGGRRRGEVAGEWVRGIKGDGLRREGRSESGLGGREQLPCVKKSTETLGGRDPKLGSKEKRGGATKPLVQKKKNEFQGSQRNPEKD